MSGPGLPNGVDPVVIRRNFMLQRRQAAATGGSLAAHLADLDNPHQTTPTKIGGVWAAPVGAVDIDAGQLVFADDGSQVVTA